MKFNKWTLGLAAVGVVSLASAVQAEERDNPVMTALSSTAISGYVDTAAVWRMGGNNGPGITVPGVINGANKADAFSLNVVGLTLEKKMDEAEWAAGYKVDMLYGPDAVGWNPSANGVQNSDFALKQAYVELRAPVGNGLDFKLGTFNSPLGFESFEAYLNPNWTHSYGWTMEPTQLTGLMMSYKFTDWLSASGGMANTASTGINQDSFRVDKTTGATVAADDSEFTYIGTLTLTAPESMGFLAGSTLTGGIVNGLGSQNNATIADKTYIYVGSTMNTPIKSLKLGAAYDGVYGDSVGNDHQGYAYSFAGYLMWQATEKLKVTGRGEYAKGTDGTWYKSSASESVNGQSNELLGLTATVDYSLWENVITRLEFRYDRDLTNQDKGGSAASAGGPFGDDDNNNCMLALNVIYRF